MTMTTDEARTIDREPVRIGEKRRFYSTLQETDSNGLRLREFSGQKVEIIKNCNDEINREEIGDDLFLVKAEDGTEFQAYGEELNGWFFDTGQWYGPY